MTPSTLQSRPVAIVGGSRIPFARSNSAYAQASNQDMLTTVLDALVERFDLAGQQLGEVVAGAVLKHPRDRDLTRESVLGTKLAATTPAYDVQQACGTGLETVAAVANKIALGQIEAGIAGGVDTTSDAPISVGEDLRRLLLDANRAKSNVERAKLLGRLRPDMLLPETPRNAEPRTGLSMGEHTALMAEDWGVTRAEQDELAARSHHRLAAAYDRGFMDDLVTPYLGLERDQNLRPDSSVEKLAKLRPVFGGEGGTMTAGNSTPLSDGASAVLLATEEWAAERGLPVLAYVTGFQTAAVDFVVRGDGLLMAPAFAMGPLLDRAGWTFADVDLFEVHEAFAAQVACTLKAWQDPVFCKERLGRDEPLGEIPIGKLNVNGGSLAAGHPFAATGGRIVASLAKALSERDGGGKAVISICAAAGQGIVATLEA
jgi:acetyl-CoA C-acetyltransferase